MKKIYEYVQKISEGRPSKKEIEDYSNIKIGKDAEHNGSGGKFGINEPKDDDAIPDDLTEDDINENTLELLDRFESEQSFFIEGKAGWGKTSIVEDMAKRFHRTVITVYLDKCVATDLGGIPIPVQGKHGAQQELAMPAWAKYMEDRPDEKFLLFFDEMNQAQPDVMNALMPIVLKREICGRMFGKAAKTKNPKDSNFFVGAAGNLQEENPGGVSELPAPLRSRFAPIIQWETNTPEAWKSAFKYIRKTWGDKISGELMSELEDNAELFESPRIVDQKILDNIISLRENSTHKQFYTAKHFFKKLKALSIDDLSRSQVLSLEKISNLMVDFINSKDSKGNGKGNESSSKRQSAKIDEKTFKEIKGAVMNGFIMVDGDDNKYGISKENIYDVFCNTDDGESYLNADMLDRILSKLETDGIKFKFKKNKDFESKFVDPLK